MDFFSFVAGALVGWLIEWLIDFFYWRRNISRWAGSQAQLQDELTTARGEVSRLHVQAARDRDLSQQLVVTRSHLDARTADLGKLQTDTDGLRTQNQALNAQLTQANLERRTLTDRYDAEVAASQSELGALRAQLDQARADRQGLTAQIAELKAQQLELEMEVTRSAAAVSILTEAAQSSAVPADDLTIIEGIGPKVAELLDQHGIRTFAQLAETSVDDLQAILHTGGSRFGTAHPETWPRQARLAADREWNKLDVLKAQLVAGVRRAPKAKAEEQPPTRSEVIPEPADDLTILEGIGPKIAELLDQNGIRTFAQLAETSVDDLQAILRSGGSRFQIANPETWPRQARLAANREWNKLDVLKAQLVAGVRRAPEAKAEEQPPTRSEEVPAPADDLTILEGIGPKIAELLDQNGLRTFAQLAETSVDDLQAILHSGGSRFQIANPETWPRQARLAANREWNKLDVLKAQLVAGVRRAPEAKAEEPDDMTLAGKDDLT